MKRTPHLLVTVALVALTMGLTACSGNEAIDNQPSPSASTSTQPTSGFDSVGGLVKVVAGDQLQLPTVPPAVSQYYTEANIRSASEFAIAVTYATAYDNALWQKIIKDPKAQVTANDVYPWSAFFTEAGKTKLLDSPASVYDTLFILPAPQPGDEYPVDALRPLKNKDNNNPYSSAKYKVSAVALGPVAPETSIPTLAVTVEDYEFYDYKHNGAWVGTATKRVITYDLAQTPNPTDQSGSSAPTPNQTAEGQTPPWLINDWQQRGAVQTMNVAPLVRGEKK